MLRVLLANAEMELVPESIAGHPQVRRLAQAGKRRPSELLLDQNQHHQALKTLEGGADRGRPDIVHYTLLTLLDSPLAKSGGLEVAIHTRGHHLVRVRGDTRLPRGEARFQGLMARVLRTGESSDEDPLIWVEGRMPPADALAKFAKGPVVRLDDDGPLTAPADLRTTGDLTLVLGAFPHGPFPEPWKTAAPRSVSLWPEPLSAWAVAADVVAAFRPPTPETPAASPQP